MIGIVRERAPRISLTVHGLAGRSQKIEAIIDTGFTSWLTISRSVIASLHLPWYTSGDVTLADGTVTKFDVYEAAVTWHRGRLESILVSEAEGDPLLGMSLLEGSEVNLQVREGGKVTIRPLPPIKKKK
jgi:clan AA aspartic protease